MGAGPIVSQQKIIAAAGQSRDLLDVLQQLAQATTQQQAVTSTTATAGATPGQPNPAARVPAQAKGAVSILGGSYVVQITNPGATTSISQLQAAQQSRNASALTSLQPVTPIYHQIRASTSPAFNVNSNTQTFGGTTGSTQTYWTLTGLGSGTWYVQFRSSYDGINFNTWRNANGGAALGGLINQVTTESAAFSEWAVFTLPGKLISGVGEGFVPDQGIMGLAEQLYSSGLFAIAGPNGFTPQGNSVYGLTLCDVDIVLPPGGSQGVVGIPDFPVEIRNQYGVVGGGLSAGSANVFAIAFDPTNENVTLFEEGGTGGAVWASFKLPGGASVAIGQGRNLDGQTIYVPPALTWIDPSRMMSICSLTQATDVGQIVTGYNLCQLSGLTMEAQYMNDSGGNWSTTANWLAIAWQQGTDVTTVGGFPFLQIALQGGHSLVIGAGHSASGTAIVLPAGYGVDQMLSIAIPGGSDNSGHHLRGVAECAFFGLLPFLQYTDNTNSWSGAVNWMVAAWL